MAAVELLIRHGVWLRRLDFVERFVAVEVDPALVGGTVLAWVDWVAVVQALAGGQLPCSGSEKQLLLIVASLAEGVPVDLSEALSGLDQANLARVAGAVLAAGGHCEAEGLAETVWR
ncbi:MAG TPA: hypothetical protein VE196_04255 [Pseudonocardiaceae bacterium]|nr:hypothetical protein [Pseudonocardiaceae bacterium]